MTTLKEIEEFAKQNTTNISVELNKDENKLTLSAHWVNSGFHEDEITGSFMRDELSELIFEIEKFDNIILTDEDSTDESESVSIITV